MTVGTILGLRLDAPLTKLGSASLAKQISGDNPGNLPVTVPGWEQRLVGDTGRVQLFQTASAVMMRT